MYPYPHLWYSRNPYNIVILQLKIKKIRHVSNHLSLQIHNQKYQSMFQKVNFGKTSGWLLAQSAVQDFRNLLPLNNKCRPCSQAFIA